MVVRKMVMMNWMKELSPNTTKGTQRLEKVCIVEYMTAPLKVRMDTFLQR